MRNIRSISVTVLGPLFLTALLTACSGGGGGNSGNGGGKTDVLTSSIAVTRTQCTPFGNPPRPRNDTLTDLQNNLTLCLLGGSRLPNWSDPNGTPRAACLFDAGGATAERKLPLVVYLHGSSSSLDTQLPLTNLLAGLSSANLTGDAARTGFILLAPLGRFTDHYYPVGNDINTVGWDVWYRQFLAGANARVVNAESFPLNADFAAIDHYIAQQVATGKVDTRRIYIFGWSAGASLALAYGQNRPGVASVAMYSGPSPYAFLNDPCSQTPVTGTPANDTELQVFNPDIPVYHIVNNCDVYATCPNSVQLRDTLGLTGTARMQHQILGGITLEQPVSSCEAACGTDPNGEPYNLLANTVGLLNHTTWPFGWTDRWYAFLREHPLAAE